MRKRRLEGWREPFKSRINRGFVIAHHAKIGGREDVKKEDVIEAMSRLFRG